MLAIAVLDVKGVDDVRSSRLTQTEYTTSFSSEVILVACARLIVTTCSKK